MTKIALKCIKCGCDFPLAEEMPEGKGLERMLESPWIAASGEDCVPDESPDWPPDWSRCHIWKAIRDWR